LPGALIDIARLGTIRLTVTPRRHSKFLGRATAWLISGVLAVGAVVGAVAPATATGPATALSSAGLDAPIHAFDWPAGAPNDPYFGNQVDLSVLAVPAAWLRTTGAPDVVVAVLDTGIDATHPELAGRIVPGFDALTGVADTTGDLGATDDDNGHGTHVSGTVAATANNAQGIAGIAPNVSLMPVKILDATGTGDFRDMVAGMHWALAHGARIITMSLGGTLDPFAVANLQPTIDAAYAAGAVLVAASGNDGATVDQYPCNFVHVICVGSTTRDGSAVSTFSTRTAGVALVAPGEAIVSTLPGGRYGYGSGTSMATPHVTAAVALLRSIAPGISVDQVVADLTLTAQPLAPGGRSPDSGFGLLQVGPAVELAAGGPPAPGPPPSPSAEPSPSPDPLASPAPSAPAVTPSPSPTPIVPAILSTTPRNGSRNVPRSTRPQIRFSIPIAGISTRTITMIDLSRGRKILVRISYRTSTGVATIRPLVPFAANHSYRIFVSGIRSASGGPGLPRTVALTFRTGYR
jgi:serine protease